MEIMKIQAKDIKVGMTVQTGVVTMKVEKVVNGFQKNGKAVVIIIGNAERFMIKGKPKRKIEGFELKLKEDTKVNI